MIILPALILSAVVQPPAQFQMPFVAENPAAAQEWQSRVRARLLAIVETQNPRKDYPLGVRVSDFSEVKNYKTATVRFTGNENTTLVATLTVPKGDGPFPALVCLHGHSGSREKVHDPKTEYKGFAAEFARRGFVTLAPTLDHCAYAPNQLWNLMRLVDVLEAQPFVDTDRIGAAGLSMGGEWTMWLAACDPRVKAAVVSGWMCTTEGVLRVPNCPCWMPPGLLELCDVAEVHILIAPRPLLFESALKDGCFPIDATRAGFQKILDGYKVFGAVQNVRQHTFPGGHAWNGGQAYAFMAGALGRKTALTAR
jgi:dienelactone hydrolase